MIDVHARDLIRQMKKDYEELKQERDRWKERWAAAVEDADNQRAINHQLMQETEQEWLGD